MNSVRRPLLILGGLGLTFALVFTLVGGGRHRRLEEQTARDHARQARQRATARKTHIRQLDPRVQTTRLSRPWSRRVLGLYNSLDPETDAENNPVHLRAELVLNHLGLLVELHDVNAPLPGDEEMARYRGVVAWFEGDRMKHPLRDLIWLQRQVQAGRRVVVLDGLGAAQDTAGRQTNADQRGAALRSLGLRLRGAFTDESHRIEVVRKDPRVVEFERPLPRRLERYEQHQLLDPASSSFLVLRRKDRADSRSDMVVVTAAGGFVARGYVYYEHKLGRNWVKQWRLNPFVFFTRALDLAHTPRPDFTTLNGARIFYSHIDGDGLPSISEIDRKSMCGDLTRRAILERYDLPVTASFVVAGIEPKPRGMGDRHRVEVARKIARLPNVEVAIHGFAHPMDWRARDKARCSYEVPGYKMSAQKEIVYAANYINWEINPPGKAVVAMLWTGWTNPAEDQLALAYQHGLYNLNGGDPVMDGQYPSYLHLAPPTHRVGRYTQYFTSGPNDYILTEEWKAPYHRWGNVIQTFKNTGAPRRVYPLNLYYHFYVVEKRSAMAAMHTVLDWVLRQRTAPLWVTQYLDVVRDFETMRIGRGGEDEPETWRVLNSGYCRTVRFDRVDRHVDLERSRGVLGYSRVPKLGAIYVHLDESHDHRIVLGATPPRRPYLLKSSAYLKQVKLNRRRVSLTMRGIGQKYLSLAGMSPARGYRVRAANGAGQQLSTRVTSSPHGTLHWQGKINGPVIRVEITREGGP